MKRIAVISLLVMIVSLAPINASDQSAAHESSHYYLDVDLNNNGSKEILTFSDGVLVISSSQNEELFREYFGSEWDGKFIEIIDINDDNIQEIIIKVRSSGTAQMLSYYIYNLINGHMQLMHYSENIYKGTLKLQGSLFVESLPIYDSGDCNASPSHIKNIFYEYANGKILEINSQVINNDKKCESFISSSNEISYRNPSFGQIERVLEQVAYEKCIPSPILKAIAWQESRGIDNDNGGIVNWRQFVNGQPLIGFDEKGIGIMQVSDYDPSNAEYINRLKYDWEFNVREGANILLDKWERGFYDIPKIGKMEPYILENWYFAIWAYNGWSKINNPIDYPIKYIVADPIEDNIDRNRPNPEAAYQLKVIYYISNKFNTNMNPLNPSHFKAGELPSDDVEPIVDAHYADIKVKNGALEYIVTASKLVVRNDDWVKCGYLLQNDIVKVVAIEPVFYNGYIRYKLKGNGTECWAAGNYLQALGDVNMDEVIDLYDLISFSRNYNKEPIGYDIKKYDLNKDNLINLVDMSLISSSYGQALYKSNFVEIGMFVE